MEPDLGALYAAARMRITELVTGVDPHTVVAATPEWTVHDVVGHLRGIVEDALTGNLDGVATDPWTAAQVVRARQKSVGRLLDEWTAEAPMFEGFLSSPAGATSARAVIDIHAHEADLRGALGLPAAIPAAYGAFMFPLMAGGIAARAEGKSLPALRILSPDGDAVGPSDAAVLLRIGRHELHRAALGRRCPEQMAAYDWSVADPAPYIALMPAFGPRPDALVD